ncbi:MAG: hypothetical protein GY699_19370 [Desulfobacteraceae bacterium]|nr:hypothetical protein [Desulfobacteraceae bacterium]
MKNQQDKPKIEHLKKIYTLYDEAIAKIDNICQKKCSSCCTCNVTMTSFEARLIVAFLTKEEKRKCAKRITQYFPEKRYIPKMTTNRFSRLCMQGKDIPEEENDPSWGKCPLLKDDLCSLYDVRPFGCRALISQINCRQKGYAQLPPVALTLNNLFLQIIEHMDQHGIFGNLSDVLRLFFADDSIQSGSSFSKMKEDKQFVFNEKIAILMVPPEHREKLNPLIKDLLYLVNNTA